MNSQGITHEKRFQEGISIESPREYPDFLEVFVFREVIQHGPKGFWLNERPQSMWRLTAETNKRNEEAAKDRIICVRKAR